MRLVSVFMKGTCCSWEIEVAFFQVMTFLGVVRLWPFTLKDCFKVYRKTINHFYCWTEENLFTVVFYTAFTISFKFQILNTHILLFNKFWLDQNRKVQPSSKLTRPLSNYQRYKWGSLSESSTIAVTLLTPEPSSHVSRFVDRANCRIRWWLV